MDKWHKGLHSWFGRCNLLKMSILPKYLYLFQALSIRIPPSYIQQVRALFTCFIWAHKKPCLPRTQLSLLKQFGGLALPNVRMYYQAIHIGRIIDWRHHSVSKLWIQIEQDQTNIALKSALWCYESLPQKLKSHPIIGITLLQGSQATQLVSLTTKDSPPSPILGHPCFPPGLPSTELKNLQNSNDENAMLELIDTSGHFQLPFWSAVQIHHFLHTIPNPQNFACQLSTFEEYCLGTDHLYQDLSKAYSLLNRPPEQPCLPCLVKWETDLHPTFTPKQKLNIFRFSLK